MGTVAHFVDLLILMMCFNTSPILAVYYFNELDEGGRHKVHKASNTRSDIYDYKLNISGTRKKIRLQGTDKSKGLG